MRIALWGKAPHEARKRDKRGNIKDGKKGEGLRFRGGGDQNTRRALSLEKLRRKRRLGAFPFGGWEPLLQQKHLEPEGPAGWLGSQRKEDPSRTGSKPRGWKLEKAGTGKE